MSLVGIWLRNSRSELIFHATAVKASATNDMMAVLVRQLAGWPYQPPAGDQTCFG
jgi:hypothetical protein